MSTLPDWTTLYASLDDAALSALGNPGLVRRGSAEVRAGKVAILSAGPDEVVVSAGAPPQQVRLFPGGPTSARCSCPVAGTCVHVVAACLWMRETGPAASPEHSSSCLDEVLTWDPSTVNRAVGIAAVRRVASDLQGQSPANLAQDVTLDEAGARLSVSWPGSPDVILVQGVGVEGALVAGSHAAVADAAWRLEAIIRLFARSGRAWTWPEGVADESVLQPGQRETLHAACGTVEGLVEGGLSHLSTDAASRVEALSHRLRLEGLPLLSNHLRSAAGLLERLAAHDDATDEGDVLSSLAVCWSLAQALTDVEGLLPGSLMGRPAARAVELGTLIPLGARWWTTATARGLTVWLLDEASGRLESVTTGRAAGTDPTFTRSRVLPMIWNASADQLTAGPFTAKDAERREDGTLSPTTRTRIADASPWGDQNLSTLSKAVSAARHHGGSGFDRNTPSVQIVLPRIAGVGGVDFDEVAQEVIWTLRAQGGHVHHLRLPAVSAEADGILRLLAERGRIEAVTVVDDRPVGIWVRARRGLTLALPSLDTRTPLGGRGFSRLNKLRTLKRARVPESSADPLSRLLDSIIGVLVDCAARGTRLSERDRSALRARAAECRVLGWTVLARALESVAEGPDPRALLRAAALADRLAALHKP